MQSTARTVDWHAGGSVPVLVPRPLSSGEEARGQWDDEDGRERSVSSRVSKLENARGGIGEEGGRGASVTLAEDHGMVRTEESERYRGRKEEEGAAPINAPQPPSATQYNADSGSHSNFGTDRSYRVRSSRSARRHPPVVPPTPKANRLRTNRRRRRTVELAFAQPQMPLKYVATSISLLNHPYLPRLPSPPNENPLKAIPLQRPNTSKAAASLSYSALDSVKGNDTRKRPASNMMSAAEQILLEEDSEERRCKQMGNSFYSPTRSKYFRSISLRQQTASSIEDLGGTEQVKSWPLFMQVGGDERWGSTGASSYTSIYPPEGNGVEALPPPSSEAPNKVVGQKETRVKVSDHSLAVEELRHANRLRRTTAYNFLLTLIDNHNLTARLAKLVYDVFIVFEEQESWFVFLASIVARR
ncbi:hypothetical protein K438DRAFT_1770446 [Mycena galopus ATCC 62051]|nr:hypothetical protein K438DRAFT_1770446 [Mycena galopus ATCC 62051]